MIAEPVGGIVHLLGPVLVAAVLLSSLGTPGSGASQPIPEIDPAVRSSVQSGRTRVIVELRVPPGGEPAAREAAIARAQDAVLARLPQSHAAVARRYASIPMLALEIDRTALGALEAMADTVVSVKADGVVRPQ
jgi:hypothetical protein